MSEPVSDAARLSEMLWRCRESLAMWADVVESRYGADAYTRGLIAQVDAYRAERGWRPSGFGGERDE